MLQHDRLYSTCFARSGSGLLVDSTGWVKLGQDYFQQNIVRGWVWKQFRLLEEWQLVSTGLFASVMQGNDSMGITADELSHIGTYFHLREVGNGGLQQWNNSNNGE